MPGIVTVALEHPLPITGLSCDAVDLRTTKLLASVFVFSLLFSFGVEILSFEGIFGTRRRYICSVLREMRLLEIRCPVRG